MRESHHESEPSCRKVCSAIAPAKRKGDAMGRPKTVNNPIFTFFSSEAEEFDSLVELTLNMHWYWNHSFDEAVLMRTKLLAQKTLPWKS